MLTRTVSTVSIRACSSAASSIAPEPTPKPRNNNENFVELISSQYKEKMNYLNKLLEHSEVNRRRVYEKVIAERKPLIELIERKLCIPGRSRLVSVGSSATGLIYDSASDIDLCFFTEDEKFYKDIHQNTDFREYFFSQLEQLTSELASEDRRLEVSTMKSFVNLAVPIMIVNFKLGLSMDIQLPMSNFQAIRNTNLAKHYVSIDPRFPQVYFYIKRLFEALGLRNSKGGLLSSYHLMMLTVHFLQCRTMQKPVLPVLCSTHPHRVGPDLPIDKVLKLVDGSIGGFENDWKSENTKTVSQLIVEMVNYYRNFDVKNSVINIGRGIVTKRKITKQEKSQLQIFDPYSNVSICKSEYIPDAFSTAISFIHRKMRAGMLIDSFPHFPEAGHFRSYAEWKPWFEKLKCI